jgi:hypothetical protein
VLIVERNVKSPSSLIQVGQFTAENVIVNGDHREDQDIRFID